MTKRDVVKTVLDGGKPPYVPWHIILSKEALERYTIHYKINDIENHIGNHFIRIGSTLGFFTDMDHDCKMDDFGVVWDRRIDKDFGTVKDCPLKEPSLAGYQFPDPHDPRFFEDIQEKIDLWSDRFSMFNMGLALFERAWSMRGMERLFMDFYDHPEFVHRLLNTIADYHIAKLRKALEFDIDAVYFMDDWGQQRGLLMGPDIWRTFIFPVLKRMYSVVKDAGKYVVIHSCGSVEELFDDLINIGVNCFNPMQPEVMDAAGILKAYRKRLSFYGGISTQRTMPFGSPEDVKRETAEFIELGIDGGYICAPSQSVEGDVPVENIHALIEILQSQPGYSGKFS